MKVNSDIMLQNCVLFLHCQVETPYIKTKSREAHTLAFRDNFHADIRIGRFIEFKLRGNRKLVVVSLSKNCLMVHDYCADINGCSV